MTDVADTLDRGPAVDTAALPVAVELPGRLAAEVRRHVEGVLGWQPVDAHTAGLVPPALRLVSPDTPGVVTAVPAVLLVADDLDPVVAAEAGARHRAAATIAWPAGRDRLEAAAARALSVVRPQRPDTEVLRVVGAGGGVGTSTVALALAGLAAWRGARVLVVAGRDAPLGEVRPVPGDALGAHDLMRRASELPGVPRARAVRADGEVGHLDGSVAGADLVVVDAGNATDGEVLVCRPDRVAMERLGATAAGAVVVNGSGPVPGRVLARAAGGRVRVEVPWSARVARAGVLARVPGALPGSWVRRLLPVVPGPGETRGVTASRDEAVRGGRRRGRSR